MPTQYARRPDRCSHCGDVVLIASTTKRPLGHVFGRGDGGTPKITQEHADPGPDGEVFDGVDAECRRPPVG